MSIAMGRGARQAAVAVLLALVLVGCQGISLVPAGPVDIGAGYRVDVARPWSDVTRILPGVESGVRVLSLDGPALNRLYLAPRIVPGKGLIEPTEDDRTAPSYRPGMSPNELVEFVTESVSELGYKRVESRGLQPAKVGAQRAIRVELAAMEVSGLEVSGVATVAEQDGGLFLVLFLAPSEHYFGALLPEVERILGSARRDG